MIIKFSTMTRTISTTIIRALEKNKISNRAEYSNLECPWTQIS